MKIDFINGKYQIKEKRKVIATFIYRPDFFKNLNVRYNNKYPYSLQINGMQAECTTLQEAIDLYYSETSYPIQ